MKSAVATQIRELNELGRHLPGSFLNIFSIRSVIRKPLTMLVIDANSAIAPSTVM